MLLINGKFSQLALNQVGLNQAVTYTYIVHHMAKCFNCKSII